MQEVVQGADIVMLAHLGPMMPVEIQEDDLMDDEELQEQATLENDQGPNVFVGRV